MKHLAHTAHHKNMKKTMQGFTLLELLVALVLVSIGILGHAKMQMKSMDMAQQAGFSQSANSALIDLAQRLKANKAITIAEEFNFTNLGDGIAPASTKNCITSTCNKTEFINYELNEWFTDLSLPNPRFSIDNDGADFTLLLTWDAAKAGVGSEKCDLSTGHQCGELNIWVR